MANPFVFRGADDAPHGAILSDETESRRSAERDEQYGTEGG
jgi:hypothetical protein